MPSTLPPSANPAAPTLYLIDGHAQMFRAFFAIRGGMTSPVTGEPTGALFAFTGMLIKLFKDCRPDYAAMVVDAEGPTFRDGIYPAYKANRDEAPSDFVAQIPRMFEIARLFGLPILEKPGFEADDVMATLATRLQAGAFDQAVPGLQLKLVAKDKDLEQVLDGRVVLYDVQTDATFDAAALALKRGITPAQVVDYQTLIGDSTDNIPGVKGIGPKTASKLITEFGSLAGIQAALPQLKGKQREQLEAAFLDGTIDLTRKLVTLDRATPIDFDLADTCTRGTEKIQGEPLLELFRTLGFNRHVDDLRRLLKLGAPAAPVATAAATAPAEPREEPAFGLFALGAPEAEPAESADPLAPARAEILALGATGRYRAITTRAELQEQVAALLQPGACPLLAVDTETVGLGHRAELCGICLAWEEGRGIYIPTRSPQPETHLDTAAALDLLRPLLENPAIPKAGHNLKYDLQVLYHAGLTLRGPLFDSMIAAFLLGAPGLGMDDLALAELGHRCIPITALIGPVPRKKSDTPQKTMDQVALDAVTVYAAEDADITLQLCRRFEPRLAELGMTALATEVEMPLVQVLAKMETAGIRVDPAVLEKQKAQLEIRIAELRREILERAGADFNPDSPKQLGEMLFTQLGFKSVRKTKTGTSTDSEVLEKLAALSEKDLAAVPEPARLIPARMLEYRMLTKLTGTYLGNLADAIWSASAGGDNRVHASFHQTGTATGRLSSSNPNLQNIPIRTEIGREIRRAFVAEPGHALIAADYSQIELRILAHLSEDAALQNAFVQGQDIHTAVAAEVFGTPLAEVTRSQRDQAKTINFGIIYGVTAFGLARRIEELDNRSAQALIENYKQRFPGIDRFMEACVQQARDHGFVTTMLGRRRAIEQVTARNPMERQLGERLAINTVVQGSAADLIKQAMVNLQQRIEQEQLPMRMLLQIHDELIFEAPQSQAPAMAAIITEEMERAFALQVPLKVEAGIGPDWFSAK